MIAQQLVNGLFLGAVYALFAVGYTLVFGVLDILNLAHAAIFMLAAFATWSMLGAGLPLPLALVLAAALAGVLGVLLDRIAFAPLRKRNAGTLIPLISSIGMAIIFGAIARGIYGVDERHFNLPLLDAPPMHVGPVTFTTIEISIFALAIVLMLALDRARHLRRRRTAFQLAAARCTTDARRSRHVHHHRDQYLCFGNRTDARPYLCHARDAARPAHSRRCRRSRCRAITRCESRTHDRRDL